MLHKVGLKYAYTSYASDSTKLYLYVIVVLFVKLDENYGKKLNKNTRKVALNPKNGNTKNYTKHTHKKEKLKIALIFKNSRNSKNCTFKYELLKFIFHNSL